VGSAGIPIEPGRNVLALIRGEARITHDNGASWTATGTGQYLEAGDEIQLTSDSLALLFLFNGSVIRLEGMTDFQLQVAQEDDQTGDIRILGRLWEGYALFETNPLPTEDSFFQLHALTSFIDVDYDAELARAVDTTFALDQQRTIIAGGSLDDEDESLYIHRGPATIYVIGWDDVDQDYVADSYPSQNEQSILLNIDFVTDPQLEANIEGFLDIAGTLVHQYAAGEPLGQGVLGYTLLDTEYLDSGEMRFFFLSDEGTIGGGDTFSDGEDRVTVVVTAHADYPAGGPPVLDVEVMVLAGVQFAGIDFGFACDLESGYGCTLPEGCDLDTGEGCMLPTGCNLATQDGCRQTRVSCEVVAQFDDEGGFLSAELVCPESQRLDCDPNIDGDCDSLYDEETWVDWDEQEDEEWCWCEASVPPGYPEPPPWMDLYYRCFCSDAGAMRERP
jgi:hypothetical protein